MRLLVTRPELDGERTAARLRDLGHDVLLAPMLKIEALQNVELGPGPWAAALLTSANAARALVSHPRLAELVRLPAFTVGRGSAAAARDAGFADVISADGDGIDLVRVVRSRLGQNRLPLLYLAGADRARDLARELALAGFTSETVVIYRAVQAAGFPPAVHAALVSGTIDGVLHFSRRSVETYLHCARDILDCALSPDHYCLSARAAEPLTIAGARRIYVANQPDEAALLALVASRAPQNRLE